MTTDTHIRATVYGKVYVAVPELKPGGCTGCAMRPITRTECQSASQQLVAAYRDRGIHCPGACGQEHTIFIEDHEASWAEYLRQRMGGT